MKRQLAFLFAGFVCVAQTQTNKLTLVWDANNPLTTNHTFHLYGTNSLPPMP